MNKVEEISNARSVSANPAYITVKGGAGDPKSSLDDPSVIITPTSNNNNNNNINNMIAKKIQFNKAYFLSVRGIIRIAIIVSLFEF